MTQQIIDRVHHHIRHNIAAAWDRELPPGANLHGDLGAKPLDLLQLVMDCEDEWPGQVYVTDEEAEAIQTVGDLERLVLAKLENPQEQPA